MKSNPWLPLGLANPLDPTLDRCREPAPNGSGESRQAMGERPSIQERVIEEVEALYPQMPKAKARELGQFMLNGLMLQLRSMGPGMHVDHWIREHCPDLHHGCPTHLWRKVGS